jgi:hypothetical protein
VREDRGPEFYKEIGHKRGEVLKDEKGFLRICIFK